LNKVADIIMADKKHLDNNPKEITKKKYTSSLRNHKLE